MPEPEEESTFTPPASQADLDKILETRLVRERQKFADYDTLKEKASKFDEADAANKTELQTLQDAIKERDDKLVTAPAEARKQAIRFASVATTKGFLDPEDALMLLGDVDLADDAAVKVALDELAERKPHLVREPPKKKPAERPKAKDGESPDGDALKGKERAAAALRQFKNT